MDFEKAYNNLVAKVKNAYLYAQTDSTKNVLEDILPELRESEDERNRKKCIELIKRVIPSGDSQSQESKEILDCIAYLEKQKERKFDFELIKQAWYMEGYKDRNFETEPRWIIKTGDDGPKYELNPRYGQPLAKEQKPAEWSEVELEFRGEKVTVKRPFYRDDKGRGYSTAELDEEVAWNALRAWCEKKGISIYDLYPKAEWSKEDEMYLSQAIETLEHENYHILADKLKSLRPSWKPGEEQMKGLKFFLDFHRPQRNAGTTNWREYDAVESLYNDLKKL